MIFLFASKPIRRPSRAITDNERQTLYVGFWLNLRGRAREQNLRETETTTRLYATCPNDRACAHSGRPFARARADAAAQS
jgi:hypothetical protein